MQNYYQNTTPPEGYDRTFMPNNAYQPYMPPVKPALTPKQQERRELKKTANGLGFFILVYFISMQIVATIISVWLYNSDALKDESVGVFNFFLQICASVSSALIAVGFYKLVFRKRLSDNFVKGRIKPATLVSVLFLGMGGAMVANMMASLFDSNLSLFQLKNTVSMSTETRSVPEIILYIVSTALVPALAEELTFRGVFMGVMRKYGDAVAIISSSVLFGAMHGNTTQIVFAFVLGLIFAYIDCKANSVIPSIIIHFFNNFYAVSNDILQSAPGVDKSTSLAVNITLVAVICILSVMSFIYLANTDKNYFRIAEGDDNKIAGKSLLTLKEKNIACFTSAGVIVSLAFFISEMILNLIPLDQLSKLLGN